MKGSADITIGNVVGSNILFVVGTKIFIMTEERLVEPMPDIRSCKKMVGIMLVVVLLTLFGRIQEKLPVNMAFIIPGAEQSIANEADDEIADAGELPNRGIQITASERRVDEAVTREQKNTRVMQVRFIALVCVLLRVIRVLYHITILRFGCRRIALWKNIFYIHLIDGAKGNDLLYT